MLRAFERWNAKRLLRPARQQTLGLAHAWLEWRTASMFSVLASRSDPANEQEMQAVVERNARLNVSVRALPRRVERAHPYERGSPVRRWCVRAAAFAGQLAGREGGGAGAADFRHDVGRREPLEQVPHTPHGRVGAPHLDARAEGASPAPPTCACLAV